VPYIITTKRPNEMPSRVGFADDMRIVGKPVAVTTLDEAREAVVATVMGALRNDPPDDYLIAQRIGESGGTVGPLPDGTVIEVRRVGWDHFGQFAQGQVQPLEYRAILDAFNAR
jgi:hypothetical protein